MAKDTTSDLKYNVPFCKQICNGPSRQKMCSTMRCRLHRPIRNIGEISNYIHEFMVAYHRKSPSSPNTRNLIKEVHEIEHLYVRNALPFTSLAAVPGSAIHLVAHLNHYRIAWFGYPI